ncbi:unnamed protein product [Caenorhabditis bovis]|uniref:Uncharacterized protein n=1 Tax=Caenorhabditis bovis TaxID=2654633 RepID=A0A8S1EWE6_9PELO|nr:unnamed protein product [Caenorhabditis bovis]
MTKETAEILEIEEKLKDEPDDAVELEQHEKSHNGRSHLIGEFYSQHGGDPREIDISYCVLLSYLPTDFLADTYNQFSECIKNLLSEDYKIDPESITKIVRIPILAKDAENQTNALRVLLCFTEKTHKHRMMSRKKEVEVTGLKLETLDELPAEFLEISDEDAHALESGGDYEMADEIGDEEEEEHHDHDDDKDNNELEYDYEGDEESERRSSKRDDENAQNGDKKDDKSAKSPKPEKPKKKIYEDEDEKAPFEVNWEGAPEFQWRLCDFPRDERKLIIENVVWADLHNPFIYRCIHRAINVDLTFPGRFTSDGSRAFNGKLTLTFPPNVPIMDEALRHLIYFRTGDGRRIKVYLPQNTQSLKRKEEFESKLGRVIKPTPRMLQLVVKVLPSGYEPSLDDACAWFPDQAVIGCELVNDEMGQPCAVVNFETAEEAIAAHAGKSFVKIETIQKSTENDVVKEEKKTSNCNVFMRGVETHFGSLVTIYDQRKKAQDERSTKVKPPSSKRVAGSSIRAAVPPKRGRGVPPPPKITKRPPIRKRSPPRSSRPPPRRIRGRSGPGSRADPRPATYRAPTYSSPSPSKGSSFRDYGYSSVRRFEDRVDPFGRPIYSGDSSYVSPFGRPEPESRYNGPSSYE